MAPSLAFTFSLMPARSGEDPVPWSAVMAEHQRALGEAQALRILRCPPGWSGTLDELVQDGRATASCEDPFAGDPHAGPTSARLHCDAVIPRFDAARLWMQVHQLEQAGGDPAAADPPGWSCLDAFPLREISNETCWFYPTEDGDYLASERSCALSFGAGALAEAQPQPLPYDRGELRLLWSLMADDEQLSCVGLTYQRRRIEFPRLSQPSSTSATWMSFRVDGMADPSFQRLSTISTYR